MDKDINHWISKCATLEQEIEILKENYCQVIGNNTSSRGVATSASFKRQETMEEKVESFEILESHCKDEVKIEFDPSKFEIVQRENGWYVAKKQPQYPKTYVECCKILNLIEDEAAFLGYEVGHKPYKESLIISFQKLLICRDAYWKIAGDWKPDWCDAYQSHYTILVNEEEIQKSFNGYSNRILAFPTKEMQDAFYENFEELIEECKELL